MDLIFCLTKIWYYYSLLLLFVGLLVKTVTPIKIVEKGDVIAVQNGTVGLVVMDCMYQVEENTNDTEGLAVKWYFNNSHLPVYQWIPEGKNNEPQDLRILKNRLLKSHRVNNNKFSIHRALAIKNPTIELTGKYKCFVSNFNMELSTETHLIVFTPARQFNISIETDEDNDEFIKVKCFADGLSPIPQMTLTKVNLDSWTLVSDVDIDIGMESETQTHSINLEKEFKVSELDSSVEFFCTLKIADTEYKETREIRIASGSEARTCLGDYLILFGFLAAVFVQRINNNCH